MHSPALEAQQFEEMPDPRDVVEHLTVPGFIRRAPHRFHLDEITRFGDKVGRAAESLHISYVTTVDNSLGVIRLFPVPLMVRVYSMMAAQFRWEPYTEPLTIESPSGAELLRANERAKRNIQTAAHSAPPEIIEKMESVLSWLESEGRRLRGENEPLRVV